jgi:hypothetical protein
VEFAVDDISQITWNDSLFDHLVIPLEHKELIKAVALSHTSEVPDRTFDDFVVGKGQGVVMLL